MIVQAACTSRRGSLSRSLADMPSAPAAHAVLKRVAALLIGSRVFVVRHTQRHSARPYVAGVLNDSGRKSCSPWTRCCR
jgi:hypothetical protein